MTNPEPALTKEQLRAEVLAIVHEKIRKLDTDFAGELTDATRIIGDLDFESVLVIELCTAVAKRFQRKLPFQELVFRNEQFHDFSVGELLEFLETHLRAGSTR